MVQIDLYEETPQIPTACHNYHRDLQTVGWRQDPPKPLDIVQPQVSTWSWDRIKAGFQHQSAPRPASIGLAMQPVCLVCPTLPISFLHDTHE